MREPDFDFWRQERERVLSKPFNEYREDIEAGNYLAAIDIILEQGKPQPEKIAALKREIALRRIVFPGRVANGKMSAEKAKHEIEVMEAILRDYDGPEPSQTADERVTR